MPEDKYRPRLSIEITREQQRDLQRLVPWGVRRQLFSTIIDDVIRITKKHGQLFIAGILQKGLELEDYSNLGLDYFGGPGCEKCIGGSGVDGYIQVEKNSKGRLICKNCGRILG